jgi:hypothetical protein
MNHVMSALDLEFDLLDLRHDERITARTNTDVDLQDTPHQTRCKKKISHNASTASSLMSAANSPRCIAFRLKSAHVGAIASRTLTAPDQGLCQAVIVALEDVVLDRQVEDAGLQLLLPSDRMDDALQAWSHDAVPFSFFSIDSKAAFGREM